MTADSRSRGAQAPFGWRRGLAYAVCWGAAAGTLESAVPIAAIDDWTVAIALSALETLPGWLFAGLVVVALARVGVPRLSGLQLLLATAAAATVVTFVRIEMRWPFISLGIRISFAGGTPTIEASAVYLGWAVFVYGGLFVGACALAQRTERTRWLLARAELARSRSETAFNMAQLSASQGLVSPAFLMRLLDEMQRRYASDVARAERLLDQLVGFLRLAMPGVRSGRSTLAAEIAVVRSYSQLAAELDPRQTEWRCELDPTLADVPFPALLLLPLLDRFAARQPSPAQIRLIGAREASQATLALFGVVAPGWLPDDLRYRLRVALQAIHADARVDECAANDAAALTITLPFADPCTNATTAPLSSRNQGEAPWTSLAPTTT
jgi:hypothetical protein